MADYNNRYSTEDTGSRPASGPASIRQQSYFRSSYWQKREEELQEGGRDSYSRAAGEDSYYRREDRGAYRQTPGRAGGDPYRRPDDVYSQRDAGYSNGGYHQGYGYSADTRRNDHGYSYDVRQRSYPANAGGENYGYAGARTGGLRRQDVIVLSLLAVIVALAVTLCIVLVKFNSGGAEKPSPAVQPTATPVVTPVPAETPAPTQTPAPVQTPAAVSQPTVYKVLDGVPDTDVELGLQQGGQVPDSYFDDAVFIGDSVTLKLKYFVSENRNTYPTLLGGAQFLTAGSLGSGNALRDVSSDSLHPSYQGQKMALEDAVAAMGAKKVYIMLGMNDVALYGIEESAQNMMKLIKRILDKSPGVQIFVQSATPRIEGDYNKLNNNALFEYNLKLYEYCQYYSSYGIHFVDVAHVMRDEKGNLPLDYCSDATGMGLHFTDKACKIWVEYLYTHTLPQ